MSLMHLSHGMFFMTALMHMFLPSKKAAIKAFCSSGVTLSMSSAQASRHSPLMQSH